MGLWSLLTGKKKEEGGIIDELEPMPKAPDLGLAINTPAIPEFEKKDDLMAIKIDTINAKIDQINQRLTNIERILTEKREPPQPMQMQKQWYAR